MLLLTGTVLDAAVTFAERVRKEGEARTFTFEGGAIKRTASFGVAGWPHPKIASCDALVRAADDALYVAKETGRNRAIRFDSDAFNAHIAEHGSEQQFDGEQERPDSRDRERPIAGDQTGRADNGGHGELRA